MNPGNAQQADRWDISVIGGGAAGHAAAIAAAWKRPSARIRILEAGDRVGRKLLATGNGRCNLSHRDMAPSRFHGRHPDFVAPALQRCPPARILRFMEEIGVYCRTEADGRIYPVSLQAVAVQDALRLAAGRAGVTTFCATPVQAVRFRDPLMLETRPLDDPYPFDIDTPEGTSRSAAVILAAGGPAAPQLGGTDSGHRLLEPLGYHVIPVLPSIVQIVTERGLVRSLAGIRFEGRLSLLAGDDVVRVEDGEVLLTEYGVSGPAALQLSGAVSRKRAGRSAGPLQLSLNFLPDWDRAGLKDSLLRRPALLPGVRAADFLTGYLNKRIGQMLLREALGWRPSMAVPALSETEADTLAAQIQDTRLAVEGVRGWRDAQVTAGGLDTSAFLPETMESRRHTGLYACGEVLDVDGDCGGFNLHWAWASGLLAGMAAASRI